MSTLVKTCHACGAKNPPGAFICGQCGADISHLVAEPPPPEPTAPPPAPADTAPEETLSAAEADANTRVAQNLCPACQQDNPVGAVVCLACGASLLEDSHDRREADPPPRQLVLVLEGSEYPLNPGDIIGRQGTVAQEVFAGYQTVSRRHLEVRRKKGAWFLRTMEGVPNTTQLDGRELPRGEDVPLTGRHTVQLSSKLSFVCILR